MGLALYNSEQDSVSQSSYSNPIISHHDGKNGSFNSQLMYVRNDDSGFYYENVTISAVDTDGDDDTIGENGSGFSVKFSNTVLEPLAHEWNLINSGNSINLGDIGEEGLADTDTYMPVWIRIGCPGNVSAQTKNDISIRLSYIRRPV